MMYGALPNGGIMISSPGSTPTGIDAPSQRAGTTGAETTPADYVRVEIRRGDTTTVYEVEGEIVDTLAPHTTDATIGMMERTIVTAHTVEVQASGRLIRGERVTKPAAEAPMQVKLYTHLLPVALTLHMPDLPADMQDVLRPHVDHQTQAEESLLGWRRVHCLTCGMDVWSVAT